jgi:hypothetical protein
MLLGLILQTLVPKGNVKDPGDTCQEVGCTIKVKG